MSYLDLARKAKEEYRRKQQVAPERVVGAIDAVIDETVLAVLIDSAVLGTPIWFAFDDSFDPEDGLPVFYVHELPELKHKTPEQLRKIYETRTVFGKGTRVRQ